MAFRFRKILTDFQMHQNAILRTLGQVLKKSYNHKKAFCSRLMLSDRNIFFMTAVVRAKIKATCDFSNHWHFLQELEFQIGETTTFISWIPPPPPPPPQFLAEFQLFTRRSFCPSGGRAPPPLLPLGFTTDGTN